MSVYDITKYGAKGDNCTDNTKAIAAAIKDCSQHGGGTVFIPAGRFLTGPIVLKSQITLYLDAGSMVIFKDEFDAYPAVRTRWSGYVCYGFTPLIFGDGLKNVSVKGEGVFDGQGKAWWDINKRLKKGEKYSTVVTEEIRGHNDSMLDPLSTNLVEWESQFLRPPLLQFKDCEHVRIEGVTLQNSPFWNTHLVYCKDVNVRGVTFKNPSDTPNGDGLDIDSCSNVRVSDCHFDVGDDCLCLKSGINEDGRRVGRPTENVAISNCTMLHGHGGVVMGSENSGGIKNVTVSNCVFIGTDRGIRIKTNRARGAYIENILVNNVYMEDVFCPFAINSFYRYGVDENDPAMNQLTAIPVSEKTPEIKHIKLSNITAKNCRASAGFIYGLPEMPVRDISLTNVHIEMTTDPDEEGGEPDMVKEVINMAGEGLYGKFIDGFELNQINIETRQGAAMHLEEVTDVGINNLRMKKVHGTTPVLMLKNAQDIYITGKQSTQLGEAYAVHENSVSNLLHTY